MYIIHTIKSVHIAYLSKIKKDWIYSHLCKGTFFKKYDQEKTSILAKKKRRRSLPPYFYFLLRKSKRCFSILARPEKNRLYNFELFLRNLKFHGLTCPFL